jgi:hypothetical protein
MLRRNMQRKLKEEDLKLLKNISGKVEMKRLDSILPLNKNSNPNLNNLVSPTSNKDKNGLSRKIDYAHLLKSNLSGLMDLKVLSGEYNLIDLFEDYSSKCGIYDDNAKMQA